MTERQVSDRQTDTQTDTRTDASKCNTCFPEHGAQVMRCCGACNVLRGCQLTCDLRQRWQRVAGLCCCRKQLNYCCGVAREVCLQKGWLESSIGHGLKSVASGLYLECSGWGGVTGKQGVPSPLLSLPSPPLPSPPLLCPPLLSLPFRPLPFLRSRPPEIQLGGLAERCKLPQRGLGQSPSRNRIWCILALKSDIWWQQF